MDEPHEKWGVDAPRARDGSVTRSTRGGYRSCNRLSTRSATLRQNRRTGERSFRCGFIPAERSPSCLPDQDTSSHLTGRSDRHSLWVANEGDPQVVQWAGFVVVLPEDLVVRRHVLTEVQLDTAEVVSPTAPGPI